MSYLDSLDDMPQQIIDAMQFERGNTLNFIAMGLAMTFGYLLYVWAVRLMRREHTDPYPLWLHCWMITIDVIGTYTAWKLMFDYDFFWVFVLFAVGLPIWVAMEAYLIYKGVKNDREEHFAGMTRGPVSERQAWFYAGGMVAVAFCINQYFLSMIGGADNAAIWIAWPFTNYVFALWTWRFWEHRAVRNGTRDGNSMGLQLIILIQITLMWVPGLSWYLGFTDFLDQRWYYVGGAAMTCLAAYNMYRLSKLPPKRPLESGAKTIW